ncbi:MAG: universal stress protein [Deltaproteobacteria bacterium]|nr:universal stress protein [Deltaproteobacteria bacterium]RLA88151.1 MAG: universal stress protein [Deltaproteobacteria bacterium]
MYKNILVPLDGSFVAEAILPEVKKLARAFEANIILLRVVMVHTIPGIDPTKAQVAAVEKAEKYLDGIKESLEKEGFSVDTHVRFGNSAEEILLHSQSNDIDIIALSTHGGSGIGKWLMGGTADKVIRHSTKPIFLVRSSTP